LLADNARSGKPDPDEMAGGLLTILSKGMRSSMR
jgi:pyruvate/2-oxoglutarate dehydrogenase complex dihydrolipoamide acyltransferase (E2) component